MRFSDQNTSERIEVTIFSILVYFLRFMWFVVYKRIYKIYCLYMIYVIFHSVFGVLIKFLLDFYGPYYDITMRLGNALVVCDWHDLFL